MGGGAWAAGCAAGLVDELGKHVPVDVGEDVLSQAASTGTEQLATKCLYRCYIVVLAQCDRHQLPCACPDSHARCNLVVVLNRNSPSRTFQAL